jgi:hypothetical protein
MNFRKTKNDKVLIVVSGGVVQTVFCSNRDIKIDLLDYDNEEFATDELAEQEYENRKKNLKQVL